jgi:hypothetical protein
MDIHMAYCSACDRQVRVTLRPGADSDDPQPEDLVCLDHGTVCTGSLCPLFLVPPPEMKERLEKMAEEEGQEGG